MYKPNHYLDNQELTELLKYFAKSYPQKCDLEILAKTDEDRDIHLLTIYKKDGRHHSDQAAYWVDAGTHSQEITGTQAAIHLAYLLLANPDNSPEISYVLDNYTVYILPRITPDGVEAVLKNNEYIRSSNKQYPDSKYHRGFEREKLCSKHQNKKPLFLRKKDPQGRWKLSKKDNRIFIPRGIAENDQDEDYYMLLSEGTFKNYDGFHQEAPNNYELDFNRNYPSEWKNDATMPGAGKFPLSQIETRTVASSITERKNICLIQSFHTFSGVTLRPFVNQPDENMPTQDLFIYKELGKINKEVTGYDCVSIDKDFKYNAGYEATGTFLEWAYSNAGIISFTTELWNIKDMVGLAKDYIPDFFNGYSEEEFFKIAAFLDKTGITKRVFSDWVEIDHPQLGKVEAGGWDMLKFITNPPEEFLEQEVDKNAKSIIAQIPALPLVKIKNILVKKISNDLHRVEIILENSGAMPTYGSDMAKNINMINLPKAVLTLTKNLALIEGKKEFEFNHIEGRTQRHNFSNYFFGHMDFNNHQVKLSWIVKGNGEITFDFDLAKAGYLSKEITI